MNIQTFEMEPAKARVMWLTYSKGMKQRRADQNKKEDEALKSMYRHMSQGKRVIMLSNVLRNAGFTPEGFPKLGIVQANASHVYFDGQGLRSGANVWGFSPHQHAHERRHQDAYVRFPASVTVPLPQGVGRWEHRAFAAVPHIPMHLRPADDLSKYHILWEPNWQRRLPDPDPVLLKRVEDDIFVVMAVWDMTPLEMAVLEGRL